LGAGAGVDPRRGSLGRRGRRGGFGWHRRRRRGTGCPGRGEGSSWNRQVVIGATKRLVRRRPL